MYYVLFGLHLNYFSPDGTGGKGEQQKEEGLRRKASCQVSSALPARANPCWKEADLSCGVLQCFGRSSMKHFP